MGEVYAAAYRRRDDGGWDTVQQPLLGRPQDMPLPAGWTVAGNALALFGDRLPAGAVAALPTAAALLRLAPVALAAHPDADAAGALPLYIRDKVAQTTEERAAERARKEMSRGTTADRTS